jgi:hypothetical protein
MAVSTLQLSIVCVTTLLLAGMLINALPRRASRARAREGIFDALALGQEVAVHLEGGQSITGTVVEVTPGVVVLRDAALVTGANRTKLQGLARIPEAGVALVQELAPVSLADVRKAAG